MRFHRARRLSPHREHHHWSPTGQASLAGDGESQARKKDLDGEKMQISVILEMESVKLKAKGTAHSTALQLVKLCPTGNRLTVLKPHSTRTLASDK